MGYLKYKDGKTGKVKFVQLDGDTAPRPIESVDKAILDALGIEFVTEDDMDEETRVKLGLSQDDLKFARGDN